MRLALVIPTMAGGGAERVMSNLANAWVANAEQLTLITFESPGTQSFYQLETGIRLVQLDLLEATTSIRNSLSANLKRIRTLRSMLKNLQPDLVVSFMTETNVVALLASLGLPAKVVVTEHTDPLIHDPGKLWRLLRNLTYRFASRVVVLNERARAALAVSLGKSVIVIPNPVYVTKPAVDDPLPPCRGPYVLAMGRFSKEKRFDLVVNAFAQVVNRFPEWSLVLVGDGEKHSAIVKLVNRLGIQDRVFFTGYLRRPQYMLYHADIFISASVLEGFPMAMTEAMASGVPVVAARYHEGIDEIISDSTQGLIVPIDNSIALTESLTALLQDKQLRNSIGAAGRVRMQAFSVERVLKLWGEMFEELGVID